MSRERRLPSLAQDALDILSQAAQDDANSPNDGDEGYDFSKPDFTKNEAQAALVANEEFTKADAEYALDLLERRGHIYYVDEEVYITPTDDRAGLQMTGTRIVSSGHGVIYDCYVQFRRLQWLSTRMSSRTSRLLRFRTLLPRQQSVKKSISSTS